MARIFISYDRDSQSIVRALAEDIESLGHSVWFDGELSGGQSWWNQILENVRNCDVFVFALASRALDSVACTREYEYAHQLGKPIIPVLIAEGISLNLLPSALSLIQYVDYREPNDKTAALNVGKALNVAPVSDSLPDPLPPPPDVPVSYVSSLAARVSASSLSYEEQMVLVADVKETLRAPATAADARILLQKLKQRQDLLARTEREIDELLNIAPVPDPIAQPRPAIEHTERRRFEYSATDYWLIAGFAILGAFEGLYVIDEFAGESWGQFFGYSLPLLAGWSAIRLGSRSYRLLTIALVASMLVVTIIDSLYDELAELELGMFPAAFAIVWGVLELEARREGAPARDIHPLVLALSGVLLGLSLSLYYLPDTLPTEFDIVFGLRVALPFLCVAIGLLSTRTTMIYTAILLVAFTLVSEFFVYNIGEELWFGSDTVLLSWGYSLRTMGESLALLLLGGALSQRAAGEQKFLKWVTSALALTVLAILGLLGVDLHMASFDPAFNGWPVFSFVVIFAAGWLYAKTGQIIGVAIALTFLSLEYALAQPGLQEIVVVARREPTFGLLILLLPVTAFFGEFFARQWRSESDSGDVTA